MADTRLEVMRDLDAFIDEALPELDPIIAHDVTSYGWRGLTQQGEVYEVKASNGHTIEVPAEIVVSFRGKPIGRRKISNDETIDIDVYLEHFNRVVALYKQNRVEEALIECAETLHVAPTLRARFNEAMVLLAAGRWREGLAEYWLCEQHAPFMRPQVRAALDRGLEPWMGQDLRGKRLVLQHAHGFGDTLMMLRYVPDVLARGAHVVLDLPPALQRMTYGPFGGDGDYFCPILHLLHWLGIMPMAVDGSPYLAVDAALAAEWRERLGPQTRKRIGIAWSIGKPSDGDYPREIPLFQLVAALRDAELHSVQIQNGSEARYFGVHVHEFEDFADCAALMACMDEIISVDTAALHLAGAIGHKRVIGLLSHWASWRWVAPWYANLQICRQTAPDDWDSALAQIHAG
jgi:hypothetical protein